MRVAATIFRGRIAPLFDSAKTALIADFRDGRQVDVEHVDLSDRDPHAKVQVLLNRRVDVVICGAVSFSTAAHAEARGLRLHAWVAGDAEELLRRVAQWASKPKRQARQDVMRVAVSAKGPDLDAQVDPRFGRCAFLVFVDEDGRVESVENPCRDLGGGVGIQTATLVADRGAEVLLTGRCGPNAFGTLDAASVRVFTGVSGTVGDAVASFRRGELQPVTSPTGSAHTGMAPDPCGGGMGWGGGGGMGRRPRGGGGPGRGGGPGPSGS